MTKEKVSVEATVREICRKTCKMHKCSHLLGQAVPGKKKKLAGKGTDTTWED